MNQEFRNRMKGNCECVSESQREKPWPEGWKMEKRLKRIIAGNIGDVVQSDGQNSCQGSVAYKQSPYFCYYYFCIISIQSSLRLSEYFKLLNCSAFLLSVNVFIIFQEALLCNLPPVIFRKATGHLFLSV